MGRTRGRTDKDSRWIISRQRMLSNKEVKRRRESRKDKRAENKREREAKNT